MESHQALFPSMEGVDLTMDSMDEQSIDEFLDIKSCPPVVFSSFSSYTFSRNPVQIPQTNMNGQVKQPISNNLSSLYPSVEFISQKASPTSSSPQIISFGNPTSTIAESYIISDNRTYRNPMFIYPDETYHKPEKFSLTTNPYDIQNNLDSSQDDDLVYKTTSPLRRSPHQALHHVVAERKRRKMLSKRFISLSKVVPGLRKLDKATILEDASKYIKTLQERVKILEEELKKHLKTFQDDDIAERCITPAFNNDNDSSEEEEEMPEIKVKISENNVLIKILCEKKYHGCLSNMLEELKRLHLTILATRVVEFGGCAIDITFGGQMDNQFSTTVNGIIKHLQIAIFQVQT